MCCAYRKLPAVLLVPVCEWSYGVGCLVEPEPVRESPGLRRGEREGQHHPMPQTDWRYFDWAPHRGPGCNYNTHTHIFMHAHTLLADRERYPVPEFSLCLFFFVCLIIVLCLASANTPLKSLSAAFTVWGRNLQPTNTRYKASRLISKPQALTCNSFWNLAAGVCSHLSQQSPQCLWEATVVWSLKDHDYRR